MSTIVARQAGDDRRDGGGCEGLHSCASDCRIRAQRGATTRRHRHRRRQRVGT